MHFFLTVTRRMADFDLLWSFINIALLLMEHEECQTFLSEGGTETLPIESTLVFACILPSLEVERGVGPSFIALACFGV